MARECIAVLSLAIVALASFIAGGPLLIAGVKELTKNCNIRLRADVVDVEPTSEYGMCSVLVRYTDHTGVTHETHVQRACVADAEGTAITGCYNARHPAALFTDTDHLDDVASHEGAQAKVTAGIVLTVFAAVAIITLCVWTVRSLMMRTAQLPPCQ